MSGLPTGLFERFINYLFQTGGISVPHEYHDRCQKIRELVDDDITGLINTVLDYAVNSASEAKYRVECSDTTLQKLLNLWLDEINLDITGIPTGLPALAKEYFKERWQGSSFCILRVDSWKKVTADKVTIEVPTVMWFVNGSSIYVVRPKDKNYKLGYDNFYLDQDHKIKIPAGKQESIVIQKPYNRWFDEYSTPYLIRKGVYKNWLGIKALQDKSDEVITKVLPYLFLISKGTENLFTQSDVNYSDDDLKEITDNFKEQVEKYRSEKGKTPTNAVPFDTKYEHLIPDLRNILTEELYRQGYRSILSGLGFVDMLEISPSRQESRLNPKAFISEVNDGVSGFKSILLEVISLIESRNKKTHPKLFSDKGKLIVLNSPLKLNIDQMLADLRSGYDRGALSIESYQEILGVDPATEKERRKKELNNGDEDLFYPHLIQNREDIPDRVVPAKPQNPKNENLNKKKGSPESKNFKAELEEAESKYIRIRQKDPSDFEDNSFRIIVLSKDQGIKAVIGNLKGKKTTTIQSYLFEKEKFTEEEANKWVEKHGGVTTSILESTLIDDNETDEEPIEAIKEELEIAPYDKNNPPKFLMKYPEGARNVFIDVFNESLPKGEDYAFPVSWTALKRWMKKHNYKKEGDKWLKKSKADLKSEEIAEKKNKLLDRLLGDKDENI